MNAQVWCLCDERNMPHCYFFSICYLFTYLSINLLSITYYQLIFMYDCMHVCDSSSCDKVMIMSDNVITPVWFLKQSKNRNKYFPN